MDELRGKSKENFTAPNNLDAVQAGCMQRMADSLERMEKPFLKLISEVEYLNIKNKQLRDRINYLENSNKSLKGWITRLKKRKQS